MALHFADTSKKVGSVNFTACDPITLRLQNAKILYEPNVYGGDGSETRVNITF